jgi:excisionase family DNA binding protein
LKKGDLIAIKQKDLAEMLNVSVRTIRIWRRKKGLRSIRIGGHVWILPNDLKTFFERHMEAGPFFQNAETLSGLVDNIIESVQ